MAITNRERVGKALDLLNDGLLPFVERELKAVYADRWQEIAREGQPPERGKGRKGEKLHLDCHARVPLLAGPAVGIGCKHCVSSLAS